MSKNQTRRTFQHLVLLFDQFRTARSMTEGLYYINSLQFLLLSLRLQQVPTVGVFLFLTHRLECSVGRLSRIVNGSFGTLFDLNSPTQYLGISTDRRASMWRHHVGCCVSDHKIYDTVVPQMYRSKCADIL